jgi:flagellar hook-associated protein 2
VSKLALAHKVSNSNPQADTTSALNLSGSFVVNGHAVEVTASDSLTTLAQKINALNAGVSAGLIDGGPNKAYLSITATSTGAKSKIQLADIDQGSVLATLGFLSGSASIREPISNGAASQKFSSATDTLATMIGSSAIYQGTVTIGTGTISVSGSDTLTTLASKINDPGNNTGATATVQAVTENGVTTYRLEITGTTTFGDEGKFWQTIGILQRGFGNQQTAAQDAEFTVDGVAITSSTNSVTTAIPGVTLNLISADVNTPKTATITLSRDTGAVKTSVKSFMDAYNKAVDFISANSGFDKETFQSGPLFGDPTALMIQNQLTSLLFDRVEGLTGNYTNLSDLGFSLDEKGKLTLDEADLDKALATDAAAVGKVFRTVGTTSSNELAFVSATAKTRASGAALYAVTITQVATKGQHTAQVAQTQPSTGEVLTFGGNLFGSSTVELTITAGMTLADTISLINNDSRLRDNLVASNVGGKLTLTSKKFGTNGNFTVSSDQPAGPDNSGIGDGTTGFVAGLDVAGTINGEPATGSGQFLTGDKGNANTDGLQIQYTGASTGLVGTLQITKGVGTLVFDTLDGYLDSVGGVFVGQDKALTDQIQAINDSIEALQSRLELREKTLRARFLAMEQTLQQLQTQSARLSAILGRQS